MKMFFAIVVAAIAAAVGYTCAAFIVQLLSEAQLDAVEAGDRTGFIRNMAPYLMILVAVGLPCLFGFVAFKLMRRIFK
jgi:hypothetical protein